MRDYFCGWYFKCQSGEKTLALIPAMHKSKGEKSCSVQLICDEGSWNISFPPECFQKQRGVLHLKVEENYFGVEGIRLCLKAPELSATGALHFGEILPIRYDIMGPFCYVPFMECRHSVVSMKHTVNGELNINGERYLFENAVGYIEGDRGYSFPKQYAWTQCSFEGGSLMLSVAEIPLGKAHFTGVISVINRMGKEYRLATYLGAKAVKKEKGELIIRQGNTVLCAKLIEKHSHPLFAPVSGNMNRTIHESAACRAFYSLQKNGKTLFSFESPKASFEYEYEN